MGNLCAGGTLEQQLPPPPDEKRKKSKKKKGVKISGQDETLETTENPMVSRKKKRDSTLKLQPKDEETKEAPTLAAPPEDNSPEKSAKSVPSSPAGVATASSPTFAARPKSRGFSLFGGSTPAPPPTAVEIVPVAPPVVIENPGKFGWLYRENDQYEWEMTKQGRASEDQWVRKWVSIADRKLYYSSEQPIDGIKCLAEGFWNLQSAHCEVKLRHIDKLISGRGRNDKVGNYCFQLRDDGKRGDDDKFSITFAATSDLERDEWMKQIKDAMGGFVHNASPCSLLIATPIASDDEKVTKFPSKVGNLKKLSMKGLLGIKTVTKRWFKLDSGDLRYYFDEKMMPSSLKRRLNLASATLVENDDPCMVSVSFEDIGEILHAEAATEALASEWKREIASTLLMLKVSGAAGAQTKRRLNLADVSPDIDEADDQKKPAGTVRFALKSQETLKLIEECIRNHFLLKTVKDTKALVDGMFKIVKLPGDIIIAEGTPGDLFFILESGLVDILGLGGNALWGKIPDVTKKYNSADPASNPKRDFGEMALLNSSGRAATIRARHLCHLWALDRKTFRKVLADQEKKLMQEKVVFLKGVALFNGMSDTTLEKIADVMKSMTFEPKVRLFKQGDSGDYMYMIQSGRASVQIANRKSGYFPKEVCQFGPGRYFGDQAIKDNAPRTATIVAVERLTCWAIDRTNFLGLLGSMQQALEESIGVSILKNVKLLKTLNEKQLMTISRVLQAEEFEPGFDILKQGDDGDKFYMVADGQVSVKINCVEVVKLGKSSFFGEGSLLRNEKRSATVTAVSKTKCLALSRENFVKYLGPLDAIMKAEAEKRKPPPEEPGFLSSMFTSEKKNVQSVLKAAATSPTRNKMFDLEQLIRVRLLGRGTFSNVYLVRHTQTEKEFALKVLYKDTLQSFHQEKAVFAERDIVTKFDNPFITTLFGTFQDAKALYMVQQFIPGGDLWIILKNNVLPKNRIGGIPTESAAFYASNALCAIAHMHDKDVIYRDLKPENLGIDNTGYLRVFDFGSAKVLQGDALTNTMVGTPEYIAPELVMSRGHNRAMDLWALGILLYEMLAGHTPFYNMNPIEIYKNIINASSTLEISFGVGFPSDAKNLIERLLVENPGMRIGMLREGIADVWSHPFLRNVPLEKVQKRDIVPPFKPEDGKKKSDELMDLIIGDFDSDFVPEYKGKFDFSSF